MSPDIFSPDHLVQDILKQVDMDCATEPLKSVVADLDLNKLSEESRDSLRILSAQVGADIEDATFWVNKSFFTYYVSFVAHCEPDEKGVAKIASLFRVHLYEGTVDYQVNAYFIDYFMGDLYSPKHSQPHPSDLLMDHLLR